MTKTGFAGRAPQEPGPGLSQVPSDVGNILKAPRTENALEHAFAALADIYVHPVNKAKLAIIWEMNRSAIEFLNALGKRGDDMRCFVELLEPVAALFVRNLQALDGFLDVLDAQPKVHGPGDEAHDGEDDGGDSGDEVNGGDGESHKEPLKKGS